MMRAFFRTFLVLSALIAAPAAGVVAQTATTGALSGVVTDAAGSALPDVQIRLTNEATGEVRVVASRGDGGFRMPLLPPGLYRIEAQKGSFKTLTRAGVRINVTEISTLDLRMEVGEVSEKISIVSDAVQVQTESSALGRVIDERTITNLPLVTRNFTQILALSAGIVSNVTDASGLGRGLGGVITGGQSSGGGQDASSHGARVYDNNFSMNGVPVNDSQGSGTLSSGIAVPNPDTIQEFKVQTGQYDAAFGRNAGANVNIVTKGGSNQFHGTAFEFFRNTALNANMFFFNRAGQKKPVLDQNQYGFTLGGPIKQDKLLFFGSYQGTRQRNGVASGCSTTFFAPPLTDDRSAAAIGRIFAGQVGQVGGVAVAANGSNINPVALRLLQMKNADGTYLISTPQRIDSTQPLLRQGFSAISKACRFDEEQFMTNLDFLQNDRSKLSGRFFFASSDTNIPYSAGAQAEGFGQTTTEDFRNFSITHTYVVSPNLFIESQFGFHYTDSFVRPRTPFNLSDVGITPGFQNDDLPSIRITGAQQLRAASPFHFVQYNFTAQESVSYITGRHSFRFGGGVQKIEIDHIDFRQGAGISFLTFTDFLLGLDAASNGTQFSHVSESRQILGNTDRFLRIWDAHVYAQDDYKLTPRLTLNLGVRYERIGAFGEAGGRNAAFDIDRALPNPPAGGTIQGWVVASNFQGTIPPGVAQFGNSSGTNARGQHNVAPRVGFAWQVLPDSSRFVLRGGYGTYFGHLIGQQLIQLAYLPPFAETQVLTGLANVNATLARPFPATPPASDFPKFPSYSPTSLTATRTIDKDLRSSITQHFSLNLQTQLARDYLLEVGYVGTRGTKLLRTRSYNQAALASAANPIRGVTTNTVANVPQRVRIQGFTANGIQTLESSGASWYHGLETSLTKRFNKGHQFLASYTWSRALDTDAGNLDGTSVGVVSTIGNQNDPSQRYGMTNFHRPHRFVLSYVYELPGPSSRTSLYGRTLGGWSVSGVTTIQTGQALTITGNNINNVFGITGDFAQLASGCTHADLVTPGAVDAKLSNYFNRSCIAPWTVVGADGRATGFGNLGAGVVRSPGQQNFDIAILKRTLITERINSEFRTEFFNAFNTPQFGLPVSNASSSAYGTISTTTVNPRIIQFALKLVF